MAARQKKRGRESSSVKLNESMTFCHQIVKQMQERPEAEPFLEPVDWQAFGLTDYPEVIKNPMDLGTVEDNLLSGKYRTPTDFAREVRLVWSNAMTYNRPDSEIYETAEKLSKAFEKKFIKVKEITQAAGGGSSGGGEGRNNNTTQSNERPSSNTASSSSSSSSTTKKKKEGGSTSTGGDDSNASISRQDRLKFSQLVNQLNSEQLGHVVEIIQKECPDALVEEDDDEIEIEINNIDAATLINLNKYAESCINRSDSGSSAHKSKKQRS